MIILFSLIIITFCFYPKIDYGRYDLEAFIGLIFLSIILSCELWKKIHWSVGITTGILFISGLYSFFFPTFYPMPIDPYLMAMKGKSEVLYSIVEILFFSSLLLINDHKFFKNILGIIFFSACADSLCLIFNHFIMNQSIPFAMLNNGTADATFIACMLPIAFEHDKRIKIPTIILLVFAILLCRSNTAMAGVFIGSSSWLYLNQSLKKWSIAMIPLISIVLMISYLSLGNHLMEDSGRYEIWIATWKFFRQYANPLIGFGTGNFTVWGDAFQRFMHINDVGKFPIWYWLHNEPLEILFENGVIGVVFFSLVYTSMLLRFYHCRSVFFSVVLVYGFIGLTEMPLRLWVTQILGICLVAMAFKDEEPLEAAQNLL